MAKNKLPVYWKRYLEQKTAEINALQNEIGEHAITFALISDLHWGYSRKNSGAVMEELVKKCNISYYFNGGDTVSGHPYFCKEGLINDIREYHECFKKTADKALLVMGNHDAAYSPAKPEEGDCYEKNLSKAELYEHYFKYLRKYKNRSFGGDAYYYADDVKRKTRFIVLNTHDIPSDEQDEKGNAVYNSFRLFCIREEQINWFAHVALDVPDREWSVVLCSHENETAHPKHITRNNPLIKGIISAFKNGGKYEGRTEFEDEPFLNSSVSVDFTGKGGNFICWLAGHIHEDKMLEIDGVTSLAICTDSTMMGCAQEVFHIGGTPSEHSIDVLVADKKSRKVYVTRVGLGENREFSY